MRTPPSASPNEHHPNEHHPNERLRTRSWTYGLWVLLCALTVLGTAAQEASEPGTEPAAPACSECHPPTGDEIPYREQVATSVHASLGCLLCHTDKGKVPHDDAQRPATGEACRGCHPSAAEEYRVHGWLRVGESPDVPDCADCHGSHRILAAENRRSAVHPANLTETCGTCHGDVDLIKNYDLVRNGIRIYRGSVHSGDRAQAGSGEVPASCLDCHTRNHDGHAILGPGEPSSPVNHFNVAATCGRCHAAEAEDFLAGIHGRLVERGETDVPVCTDCHGEHGIVPTRDPRARVSPTRLAGETCAPCHESVVLNERYGLQPGRMVSFVDSYHGLKSRAGDTEVANCASCHGVHKILPSDDPDSRVHPANLAATCGNCHPDISPELAAIPIHSVGGEGLRTPAAQLVERIYILAIVVIIGLMVLHWLVDLARHLVNTVTHRPRVRRMRPGEVWQHTLLMLTFSLLAITGFALEYETSWWVELLFGWEGGFELRGLLHRIAGVAFIAVVLWHTLFLAASRRGRTFFRDIFPRRRDFVFFWQRIAYNLGLRRTSPQAGRFTYVEKAEYWALVWGSAVMVLTGLMLWTDNQVLELLPKGALDVAWVIHFWEAWLATLAILVWHLYSTVFNPEVYPMNPSWLTGEMPEEMYAREHPRDLEEAKRQTEDG